MNRFLLAVLVSASLFGGPTPAQEPGGLQSPVTSVEGARVEGARVEGARQSGRAATITGRVVASEGNLPIANARVLARAAGAGGLRMATTDDEGNFQLTDLHPANYLIRVAAPGYILEPTAAVVPATFYRPGESVTLRMVKGGVITGRVLNASGDPMTLARVRAVRVRDAEGRPVRDFNAGRDWTTDDRGVYRLYSLEPGAYVVAANSTGMFRPVPTQPGSATEQGGAAAPIYYPSSTLDAATHVNVYQGAETRGIDIRYRVERAYSVRGTVVARAAQGGGAPSRDFISVTLSHAATGLGVASTRLQSGANNSFNFEGVPDGVYELTAQMAANTSDAAFALPQRVVVRGASVTDVLLTLTPLGSVTGRVLFETNVPAEAVEACRDARSSLLEETLISARRDETDAPKQPPPIASLLPVEAQPDASGEFALTNMNAGRYWLDVRPPSRLWYVRDLAWAATAAAAGTPAMPPPQGLTLKLGERVQGLTVKLTAGAASVAGRVVSPAKAAASPARLRVYAVPFEREHADDVLRYAETQVQPDGTFSLSHLAPGRYWLIARAEADADASNEHAGRAVILGAKTRAALRRDAEGANLAVELQPCRQVADYALRLTP